MNHLNQNSFIIVICSSVMWAFYHTRMFNVQMNIASWCVWCFPAHLLYDLFITIPTCRHRRTEDDQMSSGARCCFGLLFLTTQVLLHGLITLILYWVIQFRWKDGQGLPFAWRGTGRVALEKQWNLHPVLMVTGFIYCMGQGIPTPSMSSSIYQTSFSHACLPVM